MRSGWKDRSAVVAAALWWGSLTTTGFLVVPMLFAHLPTPAMAGQMAARLFTAQTWVAVACGLMLMMAARPRDEPVRMDWAQGALLYVLAGVLLALLVEFAIAPRIVSRVNLKVWHSLGSVLYMLQWACAGAVLWKLTAPPARSGPVRSAGPS